MYHRIESLEVDPWDLSVTPEHFDEHMAYLRVKRSPMPMDEFVSRLRKATLPRDAVAVTLDDGYVDNLIKAKPILEKHDVPATLFLATGFVGRGSEFWWDELARLMLKVSAPADLEISISGSTMRLAFADEVPTAIRSWRAWHDPIDERSRALSLVWQALRLLPLADIENTLQRLRQWRTTPTANVCDYPMSEVQLLEWCSGRGLSIAPHTVTHPSLPSLAPCSQIAEIHQSFAACRAIAPEALDGLAYPYGHMDNASRNSVLSAGLSWACTTQAGFVTTRSDILALPRMAAKNVSGGALFSSW